MTHLYVWNDYATHIYIHLYKGSAVWHDSSICVTWLIYVWHDSSICVTWLIHICDYATHIYIHLYKGSAVLLWLIHMTLSFVTHHEWVMCMSHEYIHIYKGSAVLLLSRRTSVEKHHPHATWHVVCRTWERDMAYSYVAWHVGKTPPICDVACHIWICYVVWICYVATWHATYEYAMLQHVAACCNTSQRGMPHMNMPCCNTSQHVATCRNTSQHVATRRNRSQHVATRRNMSQHVATWHATYEHAMSRWVRSPYMLHRNAFIWMTRVAHSYE